MKRKEGIWILSNGDELDFFQGIFITTIPKEESKNGEKSYIIEEHNSPTSPECNSLSVAWTDEIPINKKEKNLSCFKKMIQKYVVENHVEPVWMGFTAIELNNYVYKLFVDVY